MLGGPCSFHNIIGLQSKTPTVFESKDKQHCRNFLLWITLRLVMIPDNVFHESDSVVFFLFFILNGNEQRPSCKTCNTYIKHTAFTQRGVSVHSTWCMIFKVLYVIFVSVYTHGTYGIFLQ